MVNTLQEILAIALFTNSVLDAAESFKKSGFLQRYGKEEEIISFKVFHVKDSLKFSHHLVLVRSSLSGDPTKPLT